MRGVLALLLLLVVGGPALGAASGPVTTENVTAWLVAERGRVAPGAPVELALVLDIRPHWHTYWRNPGDSGEPTRITWQLPEGVQAGPIRWPIPKLIRTGPLANYGYSGRAVHLVALTLPADWPAGRLLDIDAEARWLVCEEICIPESGRFRLRLDTGATDGPVDPAWAGVFADARARLPAIDALPATLETSAAGQRLLIAADALPADLAPDAPVQFFADAWGLIDHAAPQAVERTGDGIAIRLAPGDAPDSAAPTGLLVAGDGRGWPVAAVRVASPTTDATPPATPLGMPLALLFAFLGGLVLNLMPCVFPVLAIKALGLARSRGAPLAERALHGLAYTAGVLVFFALVAGLLLGLRASGHAVGWGFQLQSPVFVALMAYVFLALALSLAGALTLGTRLMGIGAGLDTSPAAGHRGAFLTGALAALVAAPCTAPFMGAALGYAVTLPWAAALLVVLTLGLGLATPFLLIALVPALAQWLPRPGAWMETLKQVLAFPLFGTVAWLVWVLAVQTGADGVAAVLTGLVVLAFGLWLLEQAARVRRPLVVQLGGAAAIALALWFALLPQGTAGPATAGGATPWSAAALADARAAGRPVFVNMTAAWCITCLVNERVALSDTAVRAAFSARDLLYLKGDWTNRDPAIADYLAGFGRNGVPLYVLYPPGGTPRVLPQVLTGSLVLDALADL